MPLEIDFNICQNSSCDELTFTETTGAYNATTNPGGWGAPNPTLASVTTPVTLTVTFPNESVYTLDVATLNPSFPTDDTTLEWVLDMSSFGGDTGDSFEDGVYTFTYLVTADGSTYTQTHYVALYCQVKCCVFSMFKDLEVNCDCCEDDKKTAIDAFLLYKGLVYEAGCGNITAFNSALTELQKVCSNSNCKNCK